MTEIQNNSQETWHFTDVGIFDKKYVEGFTFTDKIFMPTYKQICNFNYIKWKNIYSPTFWGGGRGKDVNDYTSQGCDPYCTINSSNKRTNKSLLMGKGIGLDFSPRD